MWHEIKIFFFAVLVAVLGSAFVIWATNPPDPFPILQTIELAR